MAQTNFPTIKLTINGEDFSEVPPEFIQEFIFEDPRGGIYSLEFLLHDREYTRLEDALFRAPDNRVSSRIVTSFGYMINGELYSSDEIIGAIQYYLPAFGAGVDARIRAYSVGAQFDMAFREPLNFNETPYSEIVTICAKKLFGDDATIDWIQPTKEGLTFTGSTEQYTGIMNFIREALVATATDQEGNGGFTASYSAKGDTLRFGTPEFIAQKQLELKQEIPTFTWLAGEADSDVIDFAPEFDASILGNFAVSGLKCVGWDAIQKRQVTIQVNPTSAAQEKKTGKYLAKGAATLSLGKGVETRRTQGIGTEFRERIFGENSFLNNQNTWLYETFFGEAKTNDLSDVEALPYSARLSLTENTLALLEAEAFTRWRSMFDSVTNAKLVLNGSHRTVRIRGGDLIRVLVLIPGSNQVHWSSGVYFVDKARHEMTSGYTVTCELLRNAYATGVEQVPGGIKFVELGGF